MPRDPADRLRDAVEACERVACYIEGFDFRGFRLDSKTSDAVIRQFEIIGEAVKALPNDLTDREPTVRGTRLPVSATCSRTPTSRLTIRSCGTPQPTRPHSSLRRAGVCWESSLVVWKSVVSYERVARGVAMHSRANAGVFRPRPGHSKRIGVSVHSKYGIWLNLFGTHE